MTQPTANLTLSLARSGGVALGLSLSTGPSMVPGVGLAGGTSAAAGGGAARWAAAGLAGGTSAAAGAGAAWWAAAGLATAASTAAGEGRATGPAALAAAILARSPIQYLKLDETSGTTFADSSGNGRTGAAAGGVTVGVSMGAYTAARLDGINGLVNLYSVSLANAFTPDAGSMVLIASLTSDAVDAFLFNLGASSTRNINSRAFADGLGAIQFGAARQVLSGNNVSVLDAQIRALAVPLMIGISWSTADTIRLYVNGSQVAAGTALNAWGAFALAATRCVIGAQTTAAAFAWTGSVAQWGLFGSALSAADFAAIYAASGL